MMNDEADFMNPTLAPKGINYVIINGKVSLDHGKVMNNRLGKYIFNNTL